MEVETAKKACFEIAALNDLGSFLVDLASKRRGLPGVGALPTNFTKSKAGLSTIVFEKE
jgi:hypothetical protein